MGVKITGKKAVGSSVDPPTAPSNLAQTDVTSSSVSFQWDDNSSGETGFRIYRSLAGLPSPNWVLIASVGPNVTTFTDSSVNDNTAYFYKVASFNASGESESSILSVTTLVTGVAPTVISNPVSGVAQVGQTRTFSAIFSGATSFQWEVNNGGGWASISGATSNVYETPSLTLGEDGYLYRCTGTNAFGSATTNAATLTVVAATAKQYLLDEYPADSIEAVYLLFKASAAYSGALIQVKRPSDLVTGDLMPDANDGISLSSLVTNRSDAGGDVTLAVFAGGGDIFVEKIYDQSGNSRHAVLTDADANPCIVESGEITIGYNELPGVKGAGQNSTFQYNFGSDETWTNASIAMCITDYVYAGASATGRRRLCTMTSDGSGVTAAAPGFMHGQGTNYEPISFVCGAWSSDAAVISSEATIPQWHAGLFGGGTKTCMVNTLTERSESDTYGTPGAFRFLEISARGRIMFHGAVFWSKKLTESEWRSRLWVLDSIKRIAPTQAQYSEVSTRGHSIFRMRYPWQFDLYKWIKDRTAADFKFNTVATKDNGTKTITVSTSVDWSWMPVGHSVGIGDTVYTVASSSYSAPTMTIVLNEDISATAVGDEVMPAMYWDGTYSDVNELARIWNEWHTDGDSERDAALETMYDPRWALLSDGGSSGTIAFNDDAIIDESQPDATGLTGGVRDNSGVLVVRLFEVPLAALGGTRPSICRLNLSNITRGSEDTKLPYIGAKVFEDSPFDELTVTWNTSPVTMDPKPDYDDIEGIGSTNTEASLDLTQAVRAAVDNGATTITIAVYNVNDLFTSDTTKWSIRTVDFDAEFKWSQEYGVEADIHPTPVPLARNGHFSDSERDFGMHMEAVWAFRHDLPLAGGLQGNPYKGVAGYGRRSIQAAAVYLICSGQNTGDPNGVMATGYFNTHNHMSGYGIPACAVCAESSLTALMDQTTLDAFAEGVHFLLKKTEHRKPERVNANLNCKAAQFAGEAYHAFNSNYPKIGVQALRVAKLTLLGDPNGQIDTTPFAYDFSWGVFNLDGNVPEADQAESGYFGRSLAHIVDARALNHGDTAWDWMNEILNRALAWFQANMGTDENSGDIICPHGYSGRTDAMVTRSQFTPWALDYLANNYTAGRFLFNSIQNKLSPPRIPTSEADMLAEATSWINSFQAFNVSQNTVDRNEGLTTRSSNASIVTEMVPFRFVSARATWPSHIPYQPSGKTGSAWWSSAVALIAADSADMHHDGSADNWNSTVKTMPEEDGSEWWLSVQSGSGTTRYKALVHCPRKLSDYGGGSGPSLEAFWSIDAGCVVTSFRMANSPNFDQQPSGDPVATWETYSNVASEYFWGKADDYRHFILPIYEASADDTGLDVAWDSGTETLTSSRRIIRGLKNTFIPSGSDATDPVYPVLSQSSQYRVMDPDPGADAMDGLQVQHTVTYVAGSGGTDQIREFWFQIPIHAKDYTSPTTFQYWNGVNAWAGMAADTEYSGVQYIRVGKEYGAGYKYAWLILDSPMSVTARSMVKGDVRPLAINVHPTGDGSAQNFPASTTVGYKITTTDPGYVDIAISPTILFPASSDVLPAGGYWAIKAIVSSLPGLTLSNIHFEYSTDYAGVEGTATWNNIASLSGGSDSITDNGDGTYQYGGNTVALPSGITAIRARTLDSGAATVTQVVPITSAVTTLVVSDDFTGADATAVNVAYSMVTGSISEVGTSGGVIESNKLRIVSDHIKFPVADPTQIVKCAFRITNANALTEYGSGIESRSSATYNSRLSVASKGTVMRIRTSLNSDLGIKNHDAALSPALVENTDYVMVLQRIGRVTAGFVLDSSETTTLGKILIFGDNTSTTGVDARIVTSSYGAYLLFDDIDIRTFV